jgi:hypothetical protein
LVKGTGITSYLPNKLVPMKGTTLWRADAYGMPLLKNAEILRGKLEEGRGKVGPDVSLQ